MQTRRSIERLGNRIKRQDGTSNVAVVEQFSLVYPWEEGTRNGWLGARLLDVPPSQKHCHPRHHRSPPSLPSFPPIDLLSRRRVPTTPTDVIIRQPCTLRFPIKKEGKISLVSLLLECSSTDCTRHSFKHSGSAVAGRSAQL